MTNYTPTLDRFAIASALRSVVMRFVDPSVEVVRYGINRVPTPRTDDYIVINFLRRTRIATNIDTYDDGALATPPTPSVKLLLQPSTFTFQLDIHGPKSSDNAQVLETVLRDESGCDAFNAINPAIQPLYTDDAKYVQFVNGEAQYEDRWVLDVELQCNPTIVLPQDFADEVKVDLKNVPAIYPVN